MLYYVFIYKIFLFKKRHNFLKKRAIKELCYAGKDDTLITGQCHRFFTEDLAFFFTG